MVQTTTQLHMVFHVMMQENFAAHLDKNLMERDPIKTQLTAGVGDNENLR